MLRLKPNPTFKATVQIPDPGGPAMAMVCVFRHMGKAEFATFTEGVRGRSELDTVKALVVGWEEVDTPFSEAALAELLDSYPGAGFAISEAYATALLKGRQGN